MKTLVTGAAGFIGSNMCDALLAQKQRVVGVDNFSTGQKEFLENARTDKAFVFQEIDLLDFEKTRELFAREKPEVVIHLAANADVRFGLNHPRKDLEQGTLVTFNVLEASRLSGVKKIAIASTGSVYGEPEIFPTPETCPFPTQTSLYAAAKLAAEALVQAYAEGYGIKGYIFRFVSILGPRYSHGHVYDFANMLLEDPTRIEVLGDGKQRKSYLHVQDCVQAIWHVLQKCNDKVNIYNLGSDEYITVNESLDLICRAMKADPKRSYTGGSRGWVGDSPFIFLDCTKLKSTGWRANKSLRESLGETLKYLLENRWLLDKRRSA